MRFWSQDGRDESMLRAPAERRLADFPRQEPSPRARREQRAAELEAALSHLRAVHASYWDRDWRRQHRGLGRYPSTSDAAEPPAGRDGWPARSRGCGPLTGTARHSTSP